MGEEPQYAKIITDEFSTTVTYVGYAKDSFASQNDAVWDILRITQASASSPTGVSLFEWATAQGSFTNVWTSRTGLTYR